MHCEPERDTERRDVWHLAEANTLLIGGSGIALPYTGPGAPSSLVKAKTFFLVACLSSVLNL